MTVNFVWRVIADNFVVITCPCTAGRGKDGRKSVSNGAVKAKSHVSCERDVHYRFPLTSILCAHTLFISRTFQVISLEYTCLLLLTIKTLSRSCMSPDVRSTYSVSKYEKWVEVACACVVRWSEVYRSKKKREEKK